MDKEFVAGLAVRAGEILKERLGAPVVRIKFGTDVVTEADEASEQFLRAEVLGRYPDHRIIGEEYGSNEVEADWEWHLDPLDGTLNFARGDSYFSVSIAAAYRGKVQVGAVYRPLTGELYLAEQGKGATCNGRPLHVSAIDRVEESIVILDWSRRHARPETFALMERLFFASSKIRSYGSAALDLCGVASGRLEAFVHPGLATWDFAAGLLILQEAGGTVTAVDGGARTLEAGSVLGTNGRIHEEVQRLLRPEV